jgi:hypothetical protein
MCVCGDIYTVQVCQLCLCNLTVKFHILRPKFLLLILSYIRIDIRYCSFPMQRRLKRQCHDIFSCKLFSWIIFHLYRWHRRQIFHPYQWHPWQITTGILDTSGFKDFCPFATGVVDTGGAPLAATIFANLEKIRNGPNFIIRGSGENYSWHCTFNVIKSNNFRNFLDTGATHLASENRRMQKL